jgi:hypothetical protein
MYKVNIYSFEISKSIMGAEARGFENSVYRRNFTTNFVWSPSVEKCFGKKSYKAKLIRIERLINIRIAKAYRTVSNEALCVITGLFPINIKIEETAKYYERTKEYGNLFDREMEVKHWTHPVNFVTITEGQENNTHAVQVGLYTDGSRSENGVGSGIAIFIDGNITNTKKYRLNERCSNNQAEKLAILKALENMQYLETNERTVLVSTDSRITLEALKNRKNHTYLIEKSGRKFWKWRCRTGK